MPELPEVEVLRRSLLSSLPGQRIERIEVRTVALREPLDSETLAELVGHRVTALGRRAKYLLIYLEPPAREGPERTLAVHLGMSGRLSLVTGETPPERHEHVVFHLASGKRLRLLDPRRFGMVFTLPTTELVGDRHFAHLGAEPLDPSFSGATLRAAASGRRGPVKTFLMDASVVVGLGNIYASEALFRAGIHPKRSVARIAAGRWDRLAEAVVAVLEEAIAEGGTTLSDFFDGEGRSGYFQVSLDVYGREGEPCPRCEARIRRLVQAGRSTFYCPRCQR